MKSTNSRLFEVTELENRSNSVLEEINASNVENAKKIDFIQEFEATTEQKISGQESEIRILSKMLNSKFTHGSWAMISSFWNVGSSHYRPWVSGCPGQEQDFRGLPP